MKFMEEDLLKSSYRIEKEYLPIKKWPQDERPREKLIKHGSQYLTNAELLAIMLRTGISSNGSSKSALDIAKAILYRYKNLNELLDVSIVELVEIEGIGRAKAAQIIASFELGKRVISEKPRRNRPKGIRTKKRPESGSTAAINAAILLIFLS